MKLPALALATVLALPAIAQTNAPAVNSFVLVTNLWYQGYKTNVLAIADERLMADSNDIAGLVLKMEYNLAFSNESYMSNDISNVFRALNNVTNAHFHSRVAIITNDLQDFLDYLAEEHLSPEELEADRAKAHLLHKRMTYERYLKWLHEDGLF